MVHGVEECADDSRFADRARSAPLQQETRRSINPFRVRLLKGVQPLAIATIQERLAALDTKQASMQELGILPHSSLAQVDRRDITAMELPTKRC